MKTWIYVQIFPVFPRLFFHLYFHCVLIISYLFLPEPCSDKSDATYCGFIQQETQIFESEGMAVCSLSWVLLQILEVC